PPERLPLLPSAVCVTRRLPARDCYPKATIFEFSAPTSTPWLMRKRYAFVLGYEPLRKYITQPVVQRFWTESEVIANLRRNEFELSGRWLDYESASQAPKRWRWVQI